MGKLSKWFGRILVSCLFAGVNFVATPVIAASKPERHALQTAINVCFDLTSNPQNVETILIEGGWNKTADASTTFEALASLRFAIQLNVDDLDYSFRNSTFMAASILGNSSLGPDQPGFVFKDMRLAVLGLKEGTPYCIITGRKWLVEALFKTHRIQHMVAFKHTPVTSWLGYFQNHFVAISLVEKEKLLEMIPSDTDEDRAGGYRQFVDEILGEANIHISSFDLVEEK